MPIKDEILDCLVSIDDTLKRIERQMDECLVMANRIDWQEVYELNKRNNSLLTFT
jgi:hypothetical protein